MAGRGSRDDATASTDAASLAADSAVDDSLLQALAYAPTASLDLAPGTMIGASLRIAQRLGAGGMGVVYLARDLQLEREIAVKVHRGGIDPARLAREAVAMARVRHPNVITVHDVGRHGDMVYVAMEYVAGPTLRQWLAMAPRGWRAIAAIMRQIGEGLAAAHDAGIVHRDFKPENVLIGPDGRPRVGDFGLARLGASDDATAPDPETPSSPAITTRGAVIGTPAYMSPEQHAGEPVDARADQFAFCAALYEALGGVRPFAGADRAAIERAARAGELTAPSRPLPRVLRPAIVRGLAADRAQRYPSMRPLLQAIDRALGRRRIAIASGVVVAVASVGLGVGVLARSAPEAPAVPDVCAGARTAIGDVWSPARRDAIHAAFGATHRAYAEAAFTSAAAQLDAYAEAWTAQRLEACRATNVAREQPAEVLALRDACLDHHRDALGAVIDTLAHADAPMVDRALDVVGGLDDLRACADGARLTGILRPPASALHADAQVAGWIATARGRALGAAGHFAEQVEVARGAVELADRSGDPVLRSGARMALGYALQDRDPTGARDTFETGARLAAEAHDDVTAARLWCADINLLVNQLGQLDEADRLRAVAEASVARAGEDPLAAIALAEAIGRIEEGHGNLAAARAAYERAIAGIEALRGASSSSLPPILSGLSDVLANQDDFRGAHAALTRAAAIITASYGPEHPNLARIRNNEGGVLMREGRYEDARVAYADALAIQAAVYGAASAQAARTMHNLSGALDELGRTAEARDLEVKAIAILEKVAGPDSPQVARALANLASYEATLGDPERAIEHLRRVLTIETAAGGADNPDLAETLRRLGDFERKVGDLAAGVRDLTRARDILAHARQGDSRFGAIVDATLGQALSAAGKPTEALAMMQEAVAKAERALGPDHVELAEHRLGLAGQLDLAGRPREARVEAARALAIATKAAPTDAGMQGLIAAELGLIDLHLRSYPDAKAELDRGIAAIAAAQGASAYALAEPLTARAEAELALGDPAAAVHDAERATAIRAGAQQRDAEGTAATARVLARARRANRH
ncbi:MAG: serine/threonine-protein kinase [Deltaproteobacteria bacterium]|nr:serine/threonine-protein kinase [Deltaproteobacteria bacterium]